MNVDYLIAKAGLGHKLSAEEVMALMNRAVEMLDQLLLITNKSIEQARVRPDQMLSDCINPTVEHACCA